MIEILLESYNIVDHAKVLIIAYLFQLEVNWISLEKVTNVPLDQLLELMLCYIQRTNHIYELGAFVLCRHFEQVIKLSRQNIIPAFQTIGIYERP